MKNLFFSAFALLALTSLCHAQQLGAGRQIFPLTPIPEDGQWHTLTWSNPTGNRYEVVRSQIWTQCRIGSVELFSVVMETGSAPDTIAWANNLGSGEKFASLAGQCVNQDFVGAPMTIVPGQVVTLRAKVVRADGRWERWQPCEAQVCAYIWMYQD